MICCARPLPIKFGITTNKQINKQRNNTQSRSLGHCSRYHLFGLFDSLCGGILASSSGQIVGFELGTLECVFHALFGIYRRRIRLAMAVQTGIAEHCLFAIVVLLCRKYQYCRADSHAIVVNVCKRREVPVHVVRQPPHHGR